MSNGVTAWSWSRYADYTRCPLYFKENYITKTVPKVTSPAMQRGTDIHDGAKRFLLGQQDGAPRDMLKHPRVEQLLLELTQIPDKQVELQWGYTDAWKPTGWFGSATWLRVILDVNVLYPDMSADCLDWKTGKRYGHNDEQMELFALAVMCQFVPVKHVTTRLVYVDTPPGQDAEEFAEFPATHKQRLIDKWTKKVRPMFEDQVFAPRPNDKCRFCPLARSAGGKCAFG